jgi:hypothetical protein
MSANNQDDTEGWTIEAVRSLRLPGPIDMDD